MIMISSSEKHNNYNSNHKGTDCELAQRLDANSMIMIIRIMIMSLSLNVELALSIGYIQKFDSKSMQKIAE